MRTSFLLMLAFLGGCMTPYQSMKNNQYGQVEPSAPPQEIVGTWTGTNGPYLMTIRLNSDGRGLLCASWHTNESVNNVKYANGRLYLPDGMQMSASADGRRLIAAYDQKGMDPIRLTRDEQLIEASPYCKEKTR